MFGDTIVRLYNPKKKLAIGCFLKKYAMPVFAMNFSSAFYNGGYYLILFVDANKRDVGKIKDARFNGKGTGNVVSDSICFKSFFFFSLLSSSNYKYKIRTKRKKKKSPEIFFFDVCKIQNVIQRHNKGNRVDPHFVIK